MSSSQNNGILSMAMHLNPYISGFGPTIGHTNEIINENVSSDEGPETMTLWNLCRLYKVGDIIVFDLILTYLVLYILNSLFLHNDYKKIMIMTIPVVIAIETIERNKISIKSLILSLLLMMYLLHTCY
jgi:hypothetical protein